MHEHFTAIGLGLGLAAALVQGAAAQQNPVTAIDIALEPDATMVQHAMAANARLLKSFPNPAKPEPNRLLKTKLSLGRAGNFG